MFDVSFTELMVIGVIALIVIGPERLPRVAKTIGHLLGRAQRYVSDVKGDIRREIELDDLRKFKSEMDDAAQSVQSSLRDTEKSLRSHSDELRDVLDKTAKDAQAGLNGVTSATPLSGAASIPSAAVGAAGSAVSAGVSDAPPATPDPAAASASPTAAFPLADGTESVTPDEDTTARSPSASLTAIPARADDWPPPPTWSKP